MRAVRTWLRRARRDESGAAIVEFAMIAPVMILLYFGLAEFTQAMIAERKVIRTTSAIGDLVAQSSTISTSGEGGITDIFGIAGTLMRPYATGTALKICLVSIVSDASNNKTVDWTRNQNDTTCPAKGASMASVPAALMAANQGLVMSRVTYVYTGTTSQALKITPTFTKTYYLRPRRSTKVICSDC